MEAGATEEQIRDLDRMMDRDKKRMKRRNQARKRYPYSKGAKEHEEGTDSDNKYELTYVYFSSLNLVDDDGEVDNYEPIDEDADVETAAELHFLLEELQEHLSTLPPEDKAFLYEFYASYPKKKVDEIAKMFDMKVWEIYARRDRLIKQLREMFEVE